MPDDMYHGPFPPQVPSSTVPPTLGYVKTWTQPPLDTQHVTIDVNVNVNKNEADDLEVRDEIYHFAQTMEALCESEESKLGTCLHSIGIEELIRLAEEKLNMFKSAVDLRLSPETVITEACTAATYLSAAMEVYYEDFHESN